MVIVPGTAKRGIIGVGSIAQDRHIPAYLELQDKVELLAVKPSMEPSLVVRQNLRR